jgi:hypothetical protein
VTLSAVSRAILPTPSRHRRHAVLVHRPKGRLRQSQRYFTTPAQTTTNCTTLG